MKKLFCFPFLAILAAGCPSGEPVRYSPVEQKSLLGKTVENIRVRHFSIDTGDKHPVTGYLFEPVKGEDYPGLLYLHWLGGTENVDKGALEFYFEAALMAGEGFICAVPDGTFPWRSAPRSDERDLEMIKRQDLENRLVLDLLIRHKKSDGEKIGIIGHDYGGMHAFLTASSDERAGFLVVMTPVSEYWMWNRILAYIPDGEKLENYRKLLKPVDPAFTANKRRGIPLLLQFSDVDEYVSRDDTERMITAAGENTEVRRYPATHELNRHEKATSERIDWIRKQVR